jgi:hypothetical protein
MGKPMSDTEIAAAVVVPIFSIMLIIMIGFGLKIDIIIGFINTIIKYILNLVLYIKSFIDSKPTIAKGFWVISFCLMFIFSFLLGFKTVDNNVGIPIIVIFGLIVIIPFLSQIIDVIRGIIGYITNIGNNPPSSDTKTILSYIIEGVSNFLRNNIIVQVIYEIYKSILNNIDTIKDVLLADIKNTMPMFIFVIFISVIIYYANTDPDALTKNAYKYSLLIFVPFLLIMAYNITNKSSEYAFIGLFALCIVAAVGSYLWMSTNKTTIYIFSYFSKYLLIPIIVLVGVAIFYKMIMNYINNLTGVSGFIADLIFFIPCMLVDLLEYMKQQFKITPSIVYILFIIEILLILLYIYLPAVVSKSLKTKSTVLLNKPVYLSSEKLLATSKVGELDNSNSNNQTTTTMNYRRNYSISFWTMVNTHSNSNISYVNENTIFKYGHIDSNNNKNYKPYVSYKIDETGDNYTFHFSNSKDSVYKVSLPTQKWHNFVFNYNNSRVDLFINGKLERTYEFSDDLPVYSSSDEIIVGNENGLDGAVCNVQYFTVPLTNTDIANMYNLYMLKNPPVD